MSRLQGNRTVTMNQPSASSSSVLLTDAAADRLLSEPSAGVLVTVREMAGPVVVLGAGGKMGLHVCAMLVRAAREVGRDLPVIAVSRFRSLRAEAEFAEAGIRTIAADLSQGDEVARLPDAGTVFFMAGVKFGTAASPERLHRMNVEMPAMVAARYAAARIVAFSTGCVYPFVSYKTGGADEATPAAPVGAYAQSCWQREQAFVRESQRSGTPVVLVRLNYAVEYRYGVLVDIATKVWRGEPIDLTTGYVNVIWQRDAVAQIIRTVGLATSPAGVINITGAETLTVREIAEHCGTCLGREPQFSGTPQEEAWLSDARRSHRLYGAPETRWQTMVDRVVNWLRREGGTWGKPTGFEVRDGKF